MISKEKQISHLSYLEKRSHFISFLSASNETARAIGYVLTGLLTSLATRGVIGFRSISVSTSPSRDNITCIVVTIIFNAKLRLRNSTFLQGAILRLKLQRKHCIYFYSLIQKRLFETIYEYEHSLSRLSTISEICKCAISGNTCQREN